VLAVVRDEAAAQGFDAVVRFQGAKAIVVETAGRDETARRDEGAPAGKLAEAS
jgi:hypothetical protein